VVRYIILVDDLILKALLEERLVALGRTRIPDQQGVAVILHLNAV
jgi:hypothetical protein